MLVVFAVQVGYHPASEGFQDFPKSIREAHISSDKGQELKKEPEYSGEQSGTFSRGSKLSAAAFHAIIHLPVLSASYPTPREEKHAEIAWSTTSPMAEVRLWLLLLLPPITSECQGQRGKKIHTNLFGLEASKAA